MSWILWLFQSIMALQTVGFALLAGGLLALGAFTASGLFKTLPRQSAGLTMTKIFRAFDRFLSTTNVVLFTLQLLLDSVVSFLAKQLISAGYLQASVIKLGVMLAVSVLVLVYLKKNTQLEAMVGEQGEIFVDETTNNKAPFNQLHKQSEQLSKLIFMGYLLLIIWNVLVPIQLFLVQ
jgi:hypothetical protein